LVFVFFVKTFNEGPFYMGVYQNIMAGNETQLRLGQEDLVRGNLGRFVGKTKLVLENFTKRTGLCGKD
jgi:hypothetical protein